MTGDVPVVGGGAGGGGARLDAGLLRESSVLLRARPQHGDDERVAEAHHDHREHEQNDQLVPDTTPPQRPHSRD